MSEEDNTFFTPFASSIVKELAHHPYLDINSECLYLTEIRYQFARIVAHLVDQAVLIDKHNRNQFLDGKKNEISSEDQRLCTYLEKTADKLCNLVLQIDDLEDLYTEMLYTFYESANSEFLKVHEKEEN